MFSSLTQNFDVPQNRLYRERDRRNASGEPYLDLVSGNVQAHGLRFPARILSEAMSKGLRTTSVYRPHPLGQKAARQAISRFYREEGVEIPMDQLLLTPGTSLSYLYAFRLLAERGDEILCPQPSYPLFDMIAAISGVQLRPYRLWRSDGRWAIDLADLRAAVTERTKAIVLISPHNPTGAIASPLEVQGLCKIARECGLAIISDEVFSPFRFTSGPLPRPASYAAPLVLTLNGFSKMFALPGLKIGWMAVTGEPARVQTAVRALEMISDAFLPVQEAAQAAVPAIFRSGQPFLRAYQKEVRRRMQATSEALKRHPEFNFAEPEGGFFFTIHLPEGAADDESFAFEVLRREGILIHPGFFYELEGSSFVFSGIAKPPQMSRAVERLARRVRTTI